MLLICLKIACEPITIYNNNIDVMGQLTSNKCVVKLSPVEYFWELAPKPFYEKTE